MTLEVEALTKRERPRRTLVWTGGLTVVNGMARGDGAMIADCILAPERDGSGSGSGSGRIRV